MTDDQVASELLKMAKKVLAARLDLGRVVTTRGVNSEMKKDRDFARLVQKSLRRHTSGDWGETNSSDARENDEALKSGEDRIMSVYEGGSEGKFWIITEWDRSVTTVLYPSEY